MNAVSVSLDAAFATIESFFTHFKTGIIGRIEEGLSYHGSIKINASLALSLKKQDINGEVLFTDTSLRTTTQIIFHGTDLEKWFQSLVRVMLVKYENMPQQGSNWTLGSIDDLELHISKYTPLQGSSYIPLPPKIAAKKAVINIKNLRNNRCFIYAIITKTLYETVPIIRNLDRISHYSEERISAYNFDGIRFPTPFSDILIFERNNNVPINIYGVNDDGQRDSEIYPLRICENMVEDRHFDLLYLTAENGNENGHYCYITNLSRLVRVQKISHRSTVFICRRCLQHYSSDEKLVEHKQFCTHKPVRSVMPPTGAIQKFEKHQFQQRVPYVIYADFECALIPFSLAARDPNLEQSYTDKRHYHKPTSYCYYIVCSNEADITQYKPVLYRGQNAVQHFWQNIRIEVEKIARIYNNIKPIRLQEGEYEEYRRNMTSCHICGIELSNIADNEDNPNRPVLDHDHLTGKVRGWACLTCNFAYRLPNYVPIVFHNGSSYEFKLVIREIHSICNVDTNLGKRVRQSDARQNAKRQRLSLVDNSAIDADSDDEDDYDEDDILGIGEELTNQDIEERNNGSSSRRQSQAKKVGDISILAKNCENFISFEVQVTPKLSARFIDSFRFLSSSLDTLVKNLDEQQLTHTRHFFTNDQQFNLAKRKGVFPYEYITDIEKYNDPSLPTIDTFYSLLNDTIITDNEYQHAQRVWSTFDCQTLGEYSDIYLRIDVLLLADVFENFRDLCLNIYQLDVAWHYSAPGLAWNAMLKLTKVKLELLTDYTMYLFYEASIRGGYCTANERYIEANNEHMPNFDPTKPKKVIDYYDKNNLYGGSMSSILPFCLLYTSPSPRDRTRSRMPSSA